MSSSTDEIRAQLERGHKAGKRFKRTVQLPAFTTGTIFFVTGFVASAFVSSTAAATIFMIISVLGALVFMGALLPTEPYPVYLALAVMLVMSVLRLLSDISVILEAHREIDQQYKAGACARPTAAACALPTITIATSVIASSGVAVNFCRLSATLLRRRPASSALIVLRKATGMSTLTTGVGYGLAIVLFAIYSRATWLYALDCVLIAILAIFTYVNLRPHVLKRVHARLMASNEALSTALAISCILTRQSGKQENAASSFQKGLNTAVHVACGLHCPKEGSPSRGAEQSDEVMHTALANFRGLPMSSLSRDDLDPAQARHPFVYSHMVSIGEVDAFISHSWADDIDDKWLALQAWREAFVRNIGREPVVWFDRACINQENIASSLAFLPVWLASCDRLLCLGGPSYLSRLWCVMEVFVLLAMDPSASDHRRISFLPLRNGGEYIDSFDVRDTQCADPDEQMRLMAIISMAWVDLNAFNERLRAALRCASQRRSPSPKPLLLRRTRSRPSLNRLGSRVAPWSPEGPGSLEEPGPKSGPGNPPRHSRVVDKQSSPAPPSVEGCPSAGSPVPTSTTGGALGA